MMMLFGFTNNCNAQTYYYRTTSFAIKYKNNYGGWGDWSPWKQSNMLMKISMEDDIIIIYSQKQQIYRVIEYQGNFTDESGGKQVKFYVVDQDGDYGNVRLRIERNGNS